MSKKLIALAIAIAFGLSVAGSIQASDKKEKQVAKTEKTETKTEEAAPVKEEAKVEKKHSKGKKKEKGAEEKPAVEKAPETK